MSGELPAADATGVHALSPSADKIALFRSLFQGREDVYLGWFYRTFAYKPGAIPDEVIQYAAGYYGEPPAPIDPDVMDRIAAAPRAIAMASAPAPRNP